MHDLRTWLLSESRSFVMYIVGDDDVMEQTARLLASGQIAAASMEMGEGEGVALGEEEGILRKSGVAAATPSTVTETTPRQDEMARREQTVVEPEEIVLPEEEPEETELVAEVHAEPPPELAAGAEVEEHPELPSEAEVEEHPAFATEAEAGGQRVLETETAVEQAPSVALEAEAGEQHVLETETA